MNVKKFFITTPIYYINDVPHIGHAYTTLAADILARHWKKKDTEVYFLTGTDEHGLKVALSAEKKGLSPKQFADQISEKYQEAWSALNIKYDNFIRTTDSQHEKFVQEFVQKLYDKGEIFKDDYVGLYCVGCEEYKNKDDLSEGDVCPAHKTKCELVSEEIYFFRLSKYQKQITDAIKSEKFVVEPISRRNEILSFLEKEPLRDLALSRSKVTWGIQVPWDKTQTIYVWVDALLNYLSGNNGNWPPDLQLIAKDILRFHAIIWPAMLLAADLELPKKLFIHGYFTIDGQKMSKTIGNVIDPIEIAKIYGVDALRYFIFREVPFGTDGDFSNDRFAKRYEADLANDLGNLVNRVINMAKKYEIDWDYSVPQKRNNEIDNLIENLKFSEALNKIWMIIAKSNQKIDIEKPWDLAKSDIDKLKVLMNELLATLAEIADLVEPFMPETSVRIIEQLKTRELQQLFPKKIIT